MTDIETIGGIAISDPFRWLEDDADPAVIAWQDRADAATVAALAASRHRPAVEAAVQATFEDLVALWAPQRFGDVWFRTVTPPGSDYTALQVSEQPNGEGRLLLDPRDHEPGTRLLTFNPSPDGTQVLAQLMAGTAIRYLLLAVADGAVLRDFGCFPAPTGVGWAADGAGFYVRRLGLAAAPDGSLLPEPQIWWQPIAGEAEQQPVVLTDPSASAAISADGRWAAIVTNQGAPRPTWIRRQGEGEWRPFLSATSAMYKGDFVGNEYWAISDDISGWCRLVAIPIESVDDPATWREIVPARDACKLAAIRLCGSHVALTTIEDGVMRLRSIDRTGRDLGSVPLPSDGAYGLFGLGHILLLANMVVAPDGDGCTFAFSSLDRGCGFYRADLATLALEELEAPEHLLRDRVMEHARIEGPHGAVEYRILRKASTLLDGSAPVIVTGYGGFNVPQIPHYSPMAAAWTALGGLWVHAHLRGGGERDTDFWLGGRMHRKQGTFDDFFAVIEDLHARGIAMPERTGIWGSSNGGLLVGATVAQRPELVGAAVAQVPILDLFQCRKDPASYNTVMIDYGDPNDPADAPILRAYSPYHNVRAGVAYPALLCDAGADDVMTPPWHSRKMVAAVEQASASDRRVALRVRKGTGHNMMTRDLYIERDTEELIFLWEELVGA